MPDATVDLVRLCELASDLVQQAGELVETAQQAGLVVEAKGAPGDLVTPADRNCERFLVDKLQQYRPTDAIIGEEGTDLPGTSGIQWVIDPIDGTINYIYGSPIYSISLAARQDNQSLVGVVYNPPLREFYRAIQGTGAWLGDRRLHGPAPTSLAKAVIGCGFSHEVAARQQESRVVSGLLPQVRDIRILGSATLALCFAATGWIDAYFQSDIALWDYAAAALVAQEAGLKITGLAGKPAGPEYLVAASETISDDLVSALAELENS